MKFILIAVLISSQQPLVVEFNSKDACEKALAAVMPMTPILAGRGGSTAITTPAVCVEKGKP
jgi:hypothetical protein